MTPSPDYNLKILLGNVAIDEKALLADLETLRVAIKKWATRRRLWHDAGFTIPFEWRNECPRIGDVLRLSYEGPLFQIFGSGDSTSADRHEQEFTKLLQQFGFEYELEDHVSMTIFPRSEQRQAEFLALYRLQWIQRLASKRLYDIHTEVFEHFASHPDHLKRLSWRQYEELLDSIFRNQGFRTELGAGTNDGGVDIRLYQSETMPEIVTLVQAKRYTRRPIGLETVAALCGIASAERASKGLLATTSYFEPKARKFALSTQGRLDIPTIELADGGSVGEWCKEIAALLDSFFLNGATTTTPVIARAERTPLTGQVVVGTHGYEITLNSFCIIEADFPQEVILRRIGSKISDDDGYGQSGHEVAAEEIPYRARMFEQEKFVAAKHSDGISFSGDRQYFRLWDGTPQHFNHVD